MVSPPERGRVTLRARRGVCGIGAMMGFVCVCLVFSICLAGCAALLTLLLLRRSLVCE